MKRINKGEYPFRLTALKFITRDQAFSCFWNYLTKYNSAFHAPDILSGSKRMYSISRLYSYVICLYNNLS